jgi:hypothetical protein
MDIPRLSDDELGLLVWCAMGYDRRLPDAYVPDAAWQALTPEWQHRINEFKGGSRDALGAEVRPRGAEVTGQPRAQP